MREPSYTTLRTTPRARRRAILTAACLVAIAAAAEIFGRGAGPALPGFVPLLMGSVIATELLSAFVFYLEFRNLRFLSLALLATAYAFSGIVAIPYLLIFADGFSPSGLFGATPHSSLLMWIVWHAGFPLIMIALFIIYPKKTAVPAGSVTSIVAAALGACVLVAAVATAMVVTYAGLLPPLVTHAILPAIVALDLIALALVYRATRIRSTLGLWLCISVLCSALDVFMSIAASRYSYVWYLGKIFMTLSSSVVLVAFVGDIVRVRRQLRAANAGLQRSHQSLAYFKALSESTRDIIMFMDRDTMEIIEANTAACEAFGYPREELLGSNLAILQGSQGGVAASDEALERGLLFEREYWRRDGTTFPAEVFGRMTEIDGRRLYVSTARDISERFTARLEVATALDHAIEASRLKSEFVATMSHEIRTPMNGIIGMTDLLLRTPLAADQREFAMTVRESAHSLLTIINDILDFSKMEAGKVDLESILFDPAHVVHGVAKLLGTSAEAKGLTIAVDISPRIPQAVEGDPIRLRQILMNLVGNAIKFTETGEVRIGARLEQDDGEKSVLRFDVIDTGIGISEEVRAKLFNAFVQADGSMTRRYGGTGLGLAISQRLVELMGGEISACANPEGGSTFTFAAVFRHTDAMLPAPGTAAFAVLKGMRALIVDDNAIARRALTGYLSSWGLATADTDDPDKALGMLREAKAAERPFDVVLLDYVMPQKDGFVLGGEIAGDAGYGKPAMILVTAFDARGRSQRAGNAGFSAYLLKPVEPSALYNALAVIAAGSGAAVGPVDAQAAPGQSQVRILLAEDQAVNRRVALLQLKELGYEADAVVNGAQAVAAVARTRYDLILMDMQMPEVDGLAAARTIRAAEIDTGMHATIIALTANALERDRRACLDAGMDDYLAKPLEIEALRNILQRWLPLETAAAS